MANIYNSDLDAFSIYHKHEIDGRDKSGAESFPALGHAIAGSAGAAISNLALYPLDLIVTRLQVQRSLRTSVSEPEKGEYTGVVDAFNSIYQSEGGIRALYSGVVQDTGKTIADSFLFFLFYNSFRTNRLQKHGRNATTLPALDELLVGMLAGACSKACTAPISNIVTRKQTSKMLASRSGSTGPEPTVREIAQKIKEEKGYQGFWSGYSAQLILTLNPSLTFFFFETFKRLLVSREKREDPGARLTFLFAATSKALASTITYPFSMAKARAQASSRPPVDPSAAQRVKEEASSAANDKDEGKARLAGRDAKAVARRSTVFATIFKIYREEGVSALYEGVWGEILKGFFSHGTTMLIKEFIHKLVIQLYLSIIQLRNKASAMPSMDDVSSKMGELQEQASEAVSGAYNTTAEKAGHAYSSTVEQAGSAYKSTMETASNMTQNITSSGSSLGERGKVIASNLTETAKSGVSTAAGNLGLDTASAAAGIKDAAQRGQTVGENLTELAKNGSGAAAKSVGYSGQTKEAVDRAMQGAKDNVKNIVNDANDIRVGNKKSEI